MEKTYKSMKSKNRNLNPFIILLMSILILYALIFTAFLVFGTINSFKSNFQYEQYNGGDRLGLPWYEITLPNGNVIDMTNEKYKGSTYYFPHPFYNYEIVLDAIPANKNTEPYKYLAGWNLDTVMPNWKNGNPNDSFLRILFNSVFYAVVGALIIAIVPCVVGYLCAKYPYRFSSLLYTITLVVMILPIVGSDPSRIELMCRLYLFDTMIGDFIVNFTFTNVYFLVFYAFYQGVSGTYAEAAEIDGASQLRTMVSIVMPLASKMIATVTLIFFMNRWNSYNWQMLYMPNVWMIAYRIYIITTSTSNAAGSIAVNPPACIAASMILALPIVALFIAFRNKIMGNISMGGLKE